MIYTVRFRLLNAIELQMVTGKILAVFFHVLNHGLILLLIHLRLTLELHSSETWFVNDLIVNVCQL